MALDQSDLDVWLFLVKLASNCPLGDHVRFAAHSLLKKMGRHTGKSQHEWLKISINRLFTCSVQLSYNGKNYNGHLINDWFNDDSTKEHVFTLNPKLAVFLQMSCGLGSRLQKD